MHSLERERERESKSQSLSIDVAVFILVLDWGPAKLNAEVLGLNPIERTERVLTWGENTKNAKKNNDKTTEKQW